MSFFNPFKNLKAFYKSSLMQKWRDSFYSIFGVFQDPSYNPLLALSISDFIYFDDKDYQRLFKNSYSAREDVKVGVYDYLTLMLPLAFDWLVKYYCIGVCLAVINLLNLASHESIYPWNWRPHSFEVLHILTVPIAATLIMALCVIPYTLNLISWGVRALVSSALFLVSLPIVTLAHGVSQSHLKARAGKLHFEHDPFTLAEHLSYENNDYKNLQIEHLSTAGISLRIDRTNIRARCQLDEDNKDALKALFDLKGDELPLRHSFFEKQYLRNDSDKYESAISNSLIIKRDSEHEFEDLLKYLLENAPRRSGLDLSCIEIGSSIAPNAKISLEQFIKLIRAIPRNICYLDLSSNNLSSLSDASLGLLLGAIPNHIKAVNLGFNGIAPYYGKKLLPVTVTRVYWEYSGLEVLLHDTDREVIDSLLIDSDELRAPKNIILEYLGPGYL